MDDIRQTPRYREIEDFFRRALEPGFGRISGAADADPSPDGRRVAFTGTKLEKLEGVPASRVCIADAETGTFEEVTGGPNDDRLPRWSPDGIRVAFLSDRDRKGRFQLFLLHAGRVGEAVGTPALEGTAEYLAWSPDGRRVLLGVAGSGAVLAGVQGSGATPTGDDDAPAWTPRVERSSDQEGWRQAWVYDVEGHEVQAASREGLNVWESSWLGADELVAVASDGPSEDTWYGAPLVAIDGEGKERVLYRSEVQLGVPAGSPSGRCVAVIEALCSDRMVVAGDLLLIDPAGGEPIRVDTSGVDVTGLAWVGDERVLYAGLRGHDSVAGWVDAASGTAHELWSSPESTGTLYPEARPVGMDGTSFAVVLQSYDRHPEVVVVRDGTPDTVASFMHDGTRSLRSEAGTLETASWTAPDGLEMAGFVAKPNGEGPFPLVTVVHGGPIGATVNRWSMRGLTTPVLVSRGYAVFFPNPRGSSGRGQAFADMVYGDMGGGDAKDVLSGIDALIERGVADPARLGVTGGSYGGFMSCWLITQSERFAAAVAISPVTDWTSQHFTSNIGFWDELILQDQVTKTGGAYFVRSPLSFADRVRTPTLLTGGLQDRCTPPGQAEEFYRALLENGIECELALYPEEGHGVRKLPAAIDACTRLVGWFERFMPAG